jgi:hypothetical protein
MSGLLFPIKSSEFFKMTPSCFTIGPRFWKFVSRSSECWEWCGDVTTRGYGQLTFVIKRIDARKWDRRLKVLCHRLSWQLHYGEIPDGMRVLHKCDNRVCVRPDHLFLGTEMDNYLDAIKKGRLISNRGGVGFTSPDFVKKEEWGKVTYGSRHGRRKLSQKDIELMRKRGQLL